MNGYSTMKEIEGLSAKVDSSNAKFYSINKEDSEPDDTTPAEKPVVDPTVDVQKTPAKEAETETSQVQEEAPAENYEQLYKSTKGRLDKELGGLREALVGKNTEVADLTKVVIGLQKDLAVVKESTLPNLPAQVPINDISADKLTLETSPHTKSDDAEVFGSDQIDFVTRIATQVFEAGISEFAGQVNDVFTSITNSVNDKFKLIDGKFSPLSEDIAGVKTQQINTERDLYHRELDDLVENWKKIDDDPLFWEWAKKQYDDVADKTWNMFLIEADNKCNAKRVAKIMNTYLESLIPSVEEPPILPTKPVSDIEKMVVPDNAAGVTETPNENPETSEYTYKDYSTITELVSSRKISTQDGENRLAELDKALKAGKITR